MITLSFANYLIWIEEKKTMLLILLQGTRRIHSNRLHKISLRNLNSMR